MNSGLARIQAALEVIPSEDREIWLRVGLALKSGGIGFDVWDRWASRTSAGNYDKKSGRLQWRHFKSDGGVTLGTLFHLAEEFGFDAGGTAHDTPARLPPVETPTPALAPPPSDPTGQDRVDAWFAKRGIGAATVRAHGIHLTRAWFPQTQAEQWAIALPYVLDGIRVNTKFRSIEKHFSMEKGKQRPPYNIDSVEPDYCVVVEGEMDVLAMSEAGFLSCISPPNGAASHGSLRAHAAALAHVELVVLAVDADAEGRALEARCAALYGVERCTRVVWPEGVKDANDHLVAHGASALREHVLSASWYPVSGVVEPDAVDAAARAYAKAGPPAGKLLGWPDLDRLWRVQAGELTVVTGTPGSGKSTWLDNVVLRLWQRHGLRSALFSPEAGPAGTHKARLAEKSIGVPLDGIDEHEIAQWLERAGGDFQWLEYDDSPTPQTICTAARSLHAREGLDLLIVDPFNELAVEPKSHDIGQALLMFRRLARSTGLHVVIVAHPAKLYRNRDGEYSRPSLYDIAMSSHFFNRSDMGVVVHRSAKNKNLTEVHVDKARWRHSGMIGMAELLHMPLGVYEPVETRESNIVPIDNTLGSRGPATKRETS